MHLNRSRAFVRTALTAIIRTSPLDAAFPPSVRVPTGLVEAVGEADEADGGAAEVRQRDL